MDAADMPEPAGEPEVVEDGGRRVAGCPAFLLQSREDPQQTGSGAGSGRESAQDHRPLPQEQYCLPDR